MSERLQRFTNPTAFYQAGLDRIKRAAVESVAVRGHFSLVLSGGTTPLPLYAAMASHGLGVPWETVIFFFGDERLVPTGDRRSNFGMIAPLLFFPTPVPVGHIHPMPATIQPASQAAVVYEAEIREACGCGAKETPRFDLVLLGLGEDGHTASLFPHSPVLQEKQRLVAAVPPPTTAKPPVARLTLTIPCLNAAREALFLVAGRDKERIVNETMAARPTPALPASLITPPGGVSWMLLAAGEKPPASS